MDSDESGLMTLYCDMGRGFTEAPSGARPVLAGQASVLRFRLPAGRLHSLRLDILDREARMTLSRARVVAAGESVAAIGPGQFLAANQMEPLQVEADGIRIRTFPGADHPQVAIRLASPIVVPGRPWWAGVATSFAVLVAAVAWVGWARRSVGLRVDERAGALWRAACAAPGRAIMVMALGATVAANYPIIFFGKSLVSPGLGSALLYGRNPWVPGFQSTEEGDSNMADIDALLWQHLPYSMIQNRALFHDKELPLWNRYDSAGTALLAQGQSCFGDPLQLIPLIADGAAWSWDLKFIAAKWLFSCAVGFCVWRLTRHLPVSLLLAASAQFIGFFVYRVNHPAIFSLCYAPWILYFWLRIVDARSERGSAFWITALIGANLVEMNSGTAKEAYVLLLSLNFSGACILCMDERLLRGKLRLVGGLAIGASLFAMIASPFWLTFYRALKDNVTIYGAVQAFQVQPGLLAGLFDEALYRPFQYFSNVINPSANFLILGGLLWCAVRWRSVLADRRAAALALSSLPAAALVFGVVPPALIARVPFLGNIMHVDNTFSCVLVVIFIVLAGFGWREACQRLGSDDGRREGLAVFVLLLVVYACYLGTAQAIVRSAYFDQTWGHFLKIGAFVHIYGISLVAALAALMWAIHATLRRRFLSPAAALIAALSLGALHWRQGLQLGTAFPGYAIMPASRVDLQARSPAVDAILAMRDSPFRAVGLVDNLFPGWTGVYDLEGISGPDALMNRFYRQLMEASGIERVWDWRYRVQGGQVQSVRPLLDLLNVRFYLDYPSGGSQPALRPFRSLDMEVFESPTCWPRAFFADGVVPYRDPADLWSLIRGGGGRPFAAIQAGDLARAEPAPRILKDPGDSRVDPARDYALTANTTSFTVTASAPGIIRPDGGVRARQLRGHLERQARGLRARQPRVQGHLCRSAGDIPRAVRLLAAGPVGGPSPRGGRACACRARHRGCVQAEARARSRPGKHLRCARPHHENLKHPGLPRVRRGGLAQPRALVPDPAGPIRVRGERRVRGVGPRPALLRRGPRALRAGFVDPADLSGAAAPPQVQAALRQHPDPQVRPARQLRQDDAQRRPDCRAVGRDPGLVRTGAIQAELPDQRHARGRREARARDLPRGL